MSDAPQLKTVQIETDSSQFTEALDKLVKLLGELPEEAAAKVMAPVSVFSQLAVAYTAQGEDGKLKVVVAPAVFLDKLLLDAQACKS